MSMIEMRGITKRFGALTALDHVDFSLEKGEIHALLGENGAGKTTIMNVLYGMLQPDEGEILVEGRPVRFRDSLDAIQENIGMVSQHFMLVPVLSVTENVVAGLEPRKGLFFDFNRAAEAVEKLARENGFGLDVRARVSDLSVGECQRVEILKVLYKNAEVLIFDEPTAVLTPQEVDELFVTFRRLREMCIRDRPTTTASPTSSPSRSGSTCAPPATSSTGTASSPPCWPTSGPPTRCGTTLATRTSTTRAARGRSSAPVKKRA